jgi:hypothetical protein
MVKPQRLLWIFVLFAFPLLSGAAPTIKSDFRLTRAKAGTELTITGTDFPKDKSGIFLVLQPGDKKLEAKSSTPSTLVFSLNLDPGEYTQAKLLLPVSEGKTTELSIEGKLQIEKADATAGVSWNLTKLTDPWVISGWLPSGGQRCQQITIIPKASVTGVNIAYSTLAELSTKKPLPANAFRLCKPGGDCEKPGGGCGKAGENCEQGVKKLAEPSKLNICIADSFTTHGSFKGTVMLASAEKPDGELILQNVFISSFLVKVLGLVLISLGVWAAWFTKVFARGRLDRDVALGPVLVLRSRILDLRQQVNHATAALGARAPNTAAAIQYLDQQLSDTGLDALHLLPPRTPNPFAQSPNPADLKTYLEDLLTPILLDTVLVHGIVRASLLNTVANHAQALIAVGGIDAIAARTPATAPEQASSEVNIFLQPLVPAVAMALGGGPIPVQKQTTEAIQLQIERISGVVWFAWGALTVATGLAALVLSNPGFGTPIDLLYCFFWGFALPAVGQQLTPGSAATVLGINIPKVS